VPGEIPLAALAFRYRLDSEQFRFVGMTASALRRRKACRRRDHTTGDASMA